MNKSRFATAVAPPKTSLAEKIVFAFCVLVMGTAMAAVGLALVTGVVSFFDFG